MHDPHAPSIRHRLGLAAAVGGGVALLSAIIAGLGMDEHWPIDGRVRATLAKKRHPRIRATLDVAGIAGTLPVYLPVGLLIAAVAAHKRDITHTLPIPATIGVSAAMAYAVKQAVRRPRPFTVDGPVNERHSFPSGHTTRATATALIGAYLLVRERVVPAELAMPVALAIALATGVSRAYADAHWTTDVIGGWALGAAAAAGGALWYEEIRARSHDD